jgi:hypothetical protein
MLTKFYTTGPKSVNQVKGKVKAKAITKQYLPYLLLEKLLKMSAVTSNTPVPFHVDCPESLQNLLYRGGFVLPLIEPG